MFVTHSKFFKGWDPILADAQDGCRRQIIALHHSGPGAMTSFCHLGGIIRHVTTLTSLHIWSRESRRLNAEVLRVDLNNKRVPGCTVEYGTRVSSVGGLGRCDPMETVTADLGAHSLSALSVVWRHLQGSSIPTIGPVEK